MPPELEAKPRSHAPHYFARLGDGTALVLDVRPPDRIKLLHHRALVNPRKLITSDMAAQLREVNHLTVAQTNALLTSEYLRPHPGRRHVLPRHRYRAGSLGRSGQTASLTSRPPWFAGS